MAKGGVIAFDEYGLKGHGESEAVDEKYREIQRKEGDKRERETERVRKRERGRGCTKTLVPTSPDFFLIFRICRKPQTTNFFR